VEHSVFVYYKNKVKEGSSEKVKSTLFKKNNVISMIFLLFKPYGSVDNKHFCCKLVRVASKIEVPF
jgi:hypothetical protein